MIAEMVTGQTLSVDARNFRLSRIVPGMPA
jgi:hypothetical protein